MADVMDPKTSVVRRVRLAAVGLAILVLSSSLVGAQAVRPRAEVSPIVESDGVHAGGPVRLALRVTLPDGFHVQSDKPRDPMLIPTVLSIEPPNGVTLRQIVYPAPADFAQAGQKLPLAVFEQQFLIGVRVVLDKSVTPGEVVVPARLRYQACDASTCFPPAREEVRWVLRVVPASTSTKPQFPELFQQIRFQQ